MPVIEIEKKFILKSLPSREADYIFDIDQYYYKNKDGVWERARTYHNDKLGDRWIHTIKKSISKGVNLEDEKDLTQEEWSNFIKKCKKPGNQGRFIQKRRYVFSHNNLKWEVDEFLSGYSLIVAELEIPSPRYRFEIPDFIEKVLLLEVTGLKQFSNRNLSLPFTEL
jgi:CYTH domain-containing protein